MRATQSFQAKMIVLVSLVTTACGSNSGGTGPRMEYKAPVITGSSYSALYFSATSVDQGVQTSLLYKYALSSGTISELGSLESSDPSVQIVDDTVLVFSRHASHKRNVRIIESSSSNVAESFPDAIDLQNLTAGDPWDAVSSGVSSKIILATPYHGGLASLDIKTGSLDYIELDPTDTDMFRPFGLLVRGNNLYATQIGLDNSSHADGTQRIYRLTLTDGTPTFVDPDVSTPEIEGKTPTTSNASRFLPATGSEYNLFGLCPEGSNGCVATSERFDASDGSLSPLGNLTALGLSFLGEPVVGPDPKTIYVHALKTGASGSKVYKINIETGTIIAAIHVSQDQRIAGLFFDKSTGTLFVKIAQGCLCAFTHHLCLWFYLVSADLLQSWPI